MGNPCLLGFVFAFISTPQWKRIDSLWQIQNDMHRCILRSNLISYFRRGLIFPFYGSDLDKGRRESLFPGNTNLFLNLTETFACKCISFSSHVYFIFRRGLKWEDIIPFLMREQANLLTASAVNW